jgi:CheY-like chemotaxis protein
VETSAQVDDKNLLFKVRDTGIGIPKEKQHLIFRSFSQIDKAVSCQKPGTGLGLAICKGLVQLMGGDIWMESCPGEGSTFSFTIPLNIPAGLPPSVKERSPKPEVKKEHSRILLVEDERMLGNMIYMILNQRGHRIEMVENGREAVAKWQEDSFDLILMDMQMPEMNGVEATRVIRNLEKEKGFNPTRIIALSADVRKETQEECKAVGMDGFLTKPINFEELFSAVEQ